MHLDQYGDTGMEDILQAAILKCPLFDRDCESMRGKPLARMIPWGMNPTYRTILLQSPSDQFVGDHDFAHRMEVAGMLAIGGDTGVAKAFVQAFELQDFEFSFHGLDFLRQIDSGRAFDRAVSLLRRRINQGRELPLWEFNAAELDRLESVFRDSEDVRTAIFKEREFRIRSGTFQPTAKSKGTPDLEEALHDATLRGLNYWRVAGNRATDSEARLMFEALPRLSQNSFEEMLHFFLGTSLPTAHPRILDAALDGGPKLRWLAFRILRQAPSEEVRSVALKNLQLEDWEPEALGVLADTGLREDLNDVQGFLEKIPLPLNRENP
jgi:hypothetical protein